MEEGGDMKKMKKVALILLNVLVLSLCFSGCGLVDKMQDDFNQEEELGIDNNNTEIPTVIIDPPPETAVITGETQQVILYFADPVENKLVPEERAVTKVTGIARLVMEELIKGPAGSGLKATLPASTKLLDINIKEDGLAIVDFSGDLIKDLPASEMTETLAVYSIVNTLTQFPTVQEVEMRVDGRKVETLLGYVELSENLVRDTSIMK